MLWQAGGKRPLEVEAEAAQKRMKSESQPAEEEQAEEDPGEENRQRGPGCLWQDLFDIISSERRRDEERQPEQDRRQCLYLPLTSKAQKSMVSDLGPQKESWGLKR